MSLLLMADIFTAVDPAGKTELDVDCCACCIENKSQWTTPETRRANMYYVISLGSADHRFKPQAVLDKIRESFYLTLLMATMLGQPIVQLFLKRETTKCCSGPWAHMNE